MNEPAFIVTFVPAVSDASCTLTVPDGVAPAMASPSRNEGYDCVLFGIPPTAIRSAALIFPFAMSWAVAELVIQRDATPSVIPVGRMHPEVLPPEGAFILDHAEDPHGIPVLKGEERYRQGDGSDQRDGAIVGESYFLREAVYHGRHHLQVLLRICTSNGDHAIRLHTQSLIGPTFVSSTSFPESKYVPGSALSFRLNNKATSVPDSP